MTDIVDIVRTRLVHGRTIADSDVRLMADEIERLRLALIKCANRSDLPKEVSKIALSALFIGDADQ